MNNNIGNVIRILDEFTLIVDAGRDKLSVGESVQVYTVGEEILNIDGSVLDNFVYIKDTLDVIQTENKYSICKKNKTKSKIIRSVFALSPLLETEHTEKAALNVDENELKPIPPIDEKIHVGDLVKRA